MVIKKHPRYQVCSIKDNQQNDTKLIYFFVRQFFFSNFSNLNLSKLGRLVQIVPNLLLDLAFQRIVYQLSRWSSESVRMILQNSLKNELMVGRSSKQINWVMMYSELSNNHTVWNKRAGHVLFQK